MARIRSIHPGIASDEAFMQMSMPAKAAWPILWTECDDQGVFEWKPIVLKARIFPADNVDFEVVLAEYVALDCIQMREIDGKRFGFVRNFCRFQKPKHPSHRYILPPDLRLFVGLKPDDVAKPTPGLDPASPLATEKPVLMEDGVGVGEEAAAAACDRSDPKKLFESECRALVEPEPVMLAQDFHVIEALLDEGLRLDDVRTGIREALDRRSDAKQRYRKWGQLVGWCRTAAQNRLAGGPRASPRSPPKPVDSNPDDPILEFPGGFKRRQSFVVAAVSAWRKDPKSWPFAELSAAPDSPGCRVPKHLLELVPA